MTLKLICVTDKWAKRIHNKSDVNYRVRATRLTLSFAYLCHNTFVRWKLLDLFNGHDLSIILCTYTTVVMYREHVCQCHINYSCQVFILHHYLCTYLHHRRRIVSDERHSAVDELNSCQCNFQHTCNNYNILLFERVFRVFVNRCRRAFISTYESITNIAILRREIFIRFTCVIWSAISVSSTCRPTINLDGSWKWISRLLRNALQIFEHDDWCIV